MRRALIQTGATQNVATPSYRHLEWLTISFVVVLLISNLIGPKICQLGPFKVPGAQLLFPITYICGDIFTEVYGYSAARRAVWFGFFAMALLSVMGALAVALPPASDWHDQKAFATVFSVVPRFAIASLAGYLAGEFANAYTLARMKLATGGRWLWTRTLGSTITGQAVDTTVLVTIAFWGLPWRSLITIALSSYLLKVGYETLATPFTYIIVGRLKASEGIDTFDTETNFNPFLFDSQRRRSVLTP